MIFSAGIFMVAFSVALFVLLSDSFGEKHRWFEDVCAGVMMLGFGVAIIGVVVWIGQVLR